MEGGMSVAQVVEGVSVGREQGQVLTCAVV